MKEYVRLSLETHLFFARIMKEHSLFLKAGFAAKDTEWIQRAEYFREEFEDFHRKIVQMSNQMISGNVLRSEELVTCYTMDAENKTSELSGIPIDSRITRAQMDLSCGRDFRLTRETVQKVHHMNEKALLLVNGLIEFKEQILGRVKSCRLFTTNYPLLIEHIMREAKLYRETIDGLMRNQRVSYRTLQNQEEFWNRIMMEHALFIRGLLDPCEEELMETADGLADDFCELLEKAKKQDCCANNGYGVEGYSDRTLEKTMEIRDFKEAGTKGLLNCEVKSIILPLLADHVLREANHYIRIQKHGYMWQE